MSTSHRFAAFCRLVTGVCLLNGCSDAMRPEFDRVPWRSVTVHYCVGSSSPVTWQSWSTQDPETLRALHSALTIKRVGDLWGLVTYEYNRVEIVLATGERWDLHFFEPTRLSALKQPSPETSVAVDAEPQFFETLSNAVVSSSSDDVHFFYKERMEIRSGR